MIEEEQKEQSAKLSKMEREMEEVFGNCFKTNIFKTFDKINNFFVFARNRLNFTLRSTFLIFTVFLKF